MIEKAEAIRTAEACRARGPNGFNKGIDNTRLRPKSNAEGKVRWPKGNQSKERVLMRGLCRPAVKLAYWDMPGQVVLGEA